MKKPKKVYRVWFEQINAAMYDVEAKDEQAAIAKAERLQRKYLADPIASHVELASDKRAAAVGA